MDDNCVRASFSVLFVNGVLTLNFPSIGSHVQIRIVGEADVEQVGGWSFVLRHDPAKLRLLEVRNGDTPEFGEASISTRDGGFSLVSGFSSDNDTLSIGVPYVLAHARYQVLESLRGSRIEFVKEASDGPEASVETGFHVQGTSFLPQAVVHGVFGTRNDPSPSECPLCGFFDASPVPEVCDNGIDDNSNGLTDCDEWDCQDQSPCTESRPFRQGDVDGSGRLNLTDAIGIMLAAFYGQSVHHDCFDANDANAELNGADVVVVLTWLFLGGENLPEPFRFCARGSPGLCAETSRGCQ